MCIRDSPQLLREGDLAGRGVVGFTVGVVGDVEILGLVGCLLYTSRCV